MNLDEFYRGMLFASAAYLMFTLTFLGMVRFGPEYRGRPWINGENAYIDMRVMVLVAVPTALFLAGISIGWLRA